MNKKIAVICCVIGAGGLTYGGMNFEFQGIASTAKAIGVALSITFGAVMFFYGGYSFFKGKPTTANEKDKELYEHQKFDDERLEKLEKLYSKGEKPMAKPTTKKKEKKMSTSLTSMRRLKELAIRRKELDSLLAEVTKEEKVEEDRLLDKGWVQKNGSWDI